MARGEVAAGHLVDVFRAVCQEDETREGFEVVRRASDGSWALIRTGPASFPTVTEVAWEQGGEERAQRLGGEVQRLFSRLGGECPVRGDLMTVQLKRDGGCLVRRVCGVRFAVP